MPIRLATHLYRNRHGMFYFRFILPKDLKGYLHKCELRFSLKTEQRHDAIYFAAQIIVDLPRLAADLRRMKNDEETPPPDYFEKWRAQMFVNSSLRAKVKMLESDLAEQQERMAQMVPLARAKRVGKIMHEKGQLRGKQELEERLAFPWLPERTPLFSKLRQSYLKSLNHRPEGGAKKPPTPKTVEDYGKAIQLFITVMSDRHIGAIDREVVGEYFNILKQLPANISRLPKYRGKTIPELLAMKDPPQSEVTISKKIERISTMFGWALEERRTWGIDANPFTGYGQSGNSETSRRPFTHDELVALLTHPVFVERKFNTTYSFWLMPLAIFTGARLSELTQLDLQDFVEVDGIWCIDINDIDAGETIMEGDRKKRVKTKNARRLVPIHHELIRIGILRYVETLRGRGERHLFPELSRTRRDGTGHAASNWFGRFRVSVGVGIEAKQEAVFHSFRHLFITNILDAGGISPHQLAPIVGHEAELITGQVYWNKKNAAQRQPAVEAFALAQDILALIPTIEEVTFTAPRGAKAGRKRVTTGKK